MVIPVMEFIKYLDNTGKAPNTIKTYCYHLKLFYEFIERKNIKLNQVRLEGLVEFIGWLRNPLENQSVFNFQPLESIREETTINAILNAVLSFFEYLARSEQYEGINVFKEARGRDFKGFLHHISKNKKGKKNILKLRVKKKRIKTLTEPEVKNIIGACNCLRDKLIMMLMYEGGLRIGEVLNLQIEDIITWDNQVKITPREISLNESYIKSKRERIIHVSKELMKLYTDYLIYEYPEELEHAYVFINFKKSYFGKPMKYQSVLDLIRRLSKKTGIKFNAHMFRHTHATELVRNGWDVSYVQKRLGHPQFKLLYGHMCIFQMMI